MEVGDYVRREVGPGHRTTKWHLVESVIADAAITKCGRRMEPENTNGGLDVSKEVPADSCKRCG